MSTSLATRPRLFSIVVPVYYNAPSLPETYARLAGGAARCADVEHEFVFVDDGSGDDSFRVLEQLAAADSRVRVVRLTRNFGSHNACLAGMSVTRGDCAAVISADLQEPADLPWRMLGRWGPQTPVVIGARRRRSDAFWNVVFARMYYRVIRWLAFPRMPASGFDCFLIDRRVIDHLLRMDEANATLVGLVLWTGYDFDEITYDRLERPHGESRWTFAKRLKFLIDSVVAFSYFPVRALSALGILVGLAGFGYAGLVVVRRVVVGAEVSGWSSLMVMFLLLSGMQLIALGVLGEFLWRTLDAARRRPNFLVAETRNIDVEVTGAAEREMGQPACG